MPAESSAREFQKPRRDKVGKALKNCIYIMDRKMWTLCFVLCSSLWLWPVPVRRRSQKRNLAGVWENTRLLYAAEWSKIKSYTLSLKPVSVTLHQHLKWFDFSSETQEIYVQLHAGSDGSLLLNRISVAVDVTDAHVPPPLLCSQDILEYKKKQRPQKIKMLDGTIKTVMVDDSKTVGELLVTICSRIGMYPCKTSCENVFLLSGLPKL